MNIRDLDKKKGIIQKDFMSDIFGEKINSMTFQMLF